MAAPTIEGNPPADDFVVLPPPGEQARLAMDATDLRLAAKTSKEASTTWSPPTNC